MESSPKKKHPDDATPLHSSVVSAFEESIRTLVPKHLEGHFATECKEALSGSTYFTVNISFAQYPTALISARVSATIEPSTTVPTNKSYYQLQKQRTIQAALNHGGTTWHSRSLRGFKRFDKAEISTHEMDSYAKIFKCKTRLAAAHLLDDIAEIVEEAILPTMLLEFVGKNPKGTLQVKPVKYSLPPTPEMVKLKIIPVVCDKCRHFLGAESNVPICTCPVPEPVDKSAESE